MTLLTRPYAGETDLPRVMDLLGRCHAAGYVDVELHSIRLRLALRAPSFDALRLTLLVEDPPGRLAAFAILWRGRYLGMFVHPDARGSLEATIVEWAGARVAETFGDRSRLWLLCRDDDRLSLDLFARWGFTVVDEELRLGRPLAEPLAEPILPAGFAIRPLAGEGEVAAWDALNRAAFGPEHATVMSRHAAVVSDPDYDSALDLVAIAPDGTLAGLCFCSIPAVEAAAGSIRFGTTEPVAVAVPFRRLGLGRALVLTGLRRLAERGAGLAMLSTETDNAVAHRLYASVGYQLAYTARWFASDA
jgi:mycothiol synthase